MSFNLPQSNKKRVVIVGGGFGGLKLANKLSNSDFQVVLIDRNNYHQFPPLIYQVASAGVESSSISFPFRKIFQRRKNFYFRMAEVRTLFPEYKILQTSIGKIKYDYLVLAAGTTTNFYGNKHIEEEAMPMKSVPEDVIRLRNYIENHFSHPISTADLANILHCSRAGVFRAFRQSFGNTPGQYVTNVRIRHAQLLLQSTDMTVAQIASAVGIPDAAYFSKLFHRLSGCTAGCWREKSRERA